MEKKITVFLLAPRGVDKDTTIDYLRERGYEVVVPKDCIEYVTHEDWEKDLFTLLNEADMVCLHQYWMLDMACHLIKRIAMLLDKVLIHGPTDKDLRG